MFAGIFQFFVRRRTTRRGLLRFGFTEKSGRLRARLQRSRRRLYPECPIKRAILDRLADVLRYDRLGAIEIGDGSD